MLIARTLDFIPIVSTWNHCVKWFKQKLNSSVSKLELWKELKEVTMFHSSTNSSFYFPNYYTVFIKYLGKSWRITFNNDFFFCSLLMCNTWFSTVSLSPFYFRTIQFCSGFYDKTRIYRINLFITKFTYVLFEFLY